MMDLGNSTEARAEYFLDQLRRLWMLERLAPLAGAEGKRAKEKLAVLRHEVKELRSRLGFSVRRKVNARLRELGLPELSR